MDNKEELENIEKRIRRLEWVVAITLVFLTIVVVVLFGEYAEIWGGKYI